MPVNKHYPHPSQFAARPPDLCTWLADERVYSCLCDCACACICACIFTPAFDRTLTGLRLRCACTVVVSCSCACTSSPLHLIHLFRSCLQAHWLIWICCKIQNIRKFSIKIVHLLQDSLFLNSQARMTYWLQDTYFSAFASQDHGFQCCKMKTI